MRLNEKGRYLVGRVRLLALAFAACGAVFLVYGAADLLARGEPLTLVLLALAAYVALAFTAWHTVVRPYRLRGRAIQQMLRGYGIGEAERAMLPFDSGDELLLRQVQSWLDPSKVFQLNKRQAQYLALQNQINPHFLYNTLESIRSEALLAGLSSVADMTEALAKFFRYTISKVENLVTVEEELQNCETYYHIQQYRFAERLQLNIRCSEEDRAELYRCRLPKLTLQPILENSIIHGTELKVGVGHLTIYLQKTGTSLIIQVSDDGVGMDEKTLARLNSSLGKGALDAQMEGARRTGVALVNVDNRIRLLFGEEYGLHVYSMPGMGTTVEIRLPIITSDRDIANKEVLG